MGVPAFFRWLSMKYPKIVSHCIEEKGKYIDENTTIPVDTSQPNPNEMEFDNLYLDMNGIIHPCTHPENKPAPKNEDEMFVEIFLYIDRIFSIVRPRRLIYLAVDGVAPRAKMNQQRSRRFRAAKESREKAETFDRIRLELIAKGARLPESSSASSDERFDSNCITPGTPFMARLTIALQYFIYQKLHSDPGWAGIQVILSDANVPGEGEHKIMDFIRRQRNNPAHDPNTRHCLCGADADLIMLGLATHEPYFTIIREEFKPNQPRPCEMCHQMGHVMTECQGLASVEFNLGVTSTPNKAGSNVVPDQTEFIFIHLNILREYLRRDLSIGTGLFQRPDEFERAIDDWVFMCFFVGNDFLPHLPSLEIREKAIDRLIELYLASMNRCQLNKNRQSIDWLTDSGQVNLARVQSIMTDLATLEDEIFRSRRTSEMDFRRRNRDRRQKQLSARWKRQRLDTDQEFFQKSVTEFVCPARRERFPMVSVKDQAVAELRRQSVQGTKIDWDGQRRDAGRQSWGGADSKTGTWDDKERGKLKGSGMEGSGTFTMNDGGSNQSRKRRHSKSSPPPVDKIDLQDEEMDRNDTIKLWEQGYRSRYYKSKFGVSVDEEDENEKGEKIDGKSFGERVAHDYVRGLCWVLAYYYQGCVSWKWYYPHHYAPFACDFHNLIDLKIDFRVDYNSDEINGGRIDDSSSLMAEIDRDPMEPFRPLEQLMAVFPADSRSHVPPAWQGLMIDSDSPVIDLYPSDFKIDLNGKRYEWQGVALLPFVDERRLLLALRDRYGLLTEEERERNRLGCDRYYVRASHSIAELISECCYGNDCRDDAIDGYQKTVIDPQLTNGVTGTIWTDMKAYRPGDTVKTPISNDPQQSDINSVKVIGCFYKDPQFPEDFLFKARLLDKVVMPPATLGDEALKKDRKHFDTEPMNRMINHSLNSNFDDGNQKGINPKFRHYLHSSNDLTFNNNSYSQQIDRYNQPFRGGGSRFRSNSIDSYTNSGSYTPSSFDVQQSFSNNDLHIQPSPDSRYRFSGTVHDQQQHQQNHRYQSSQQPHYSAGYNNRSNDGVGNRSNTGSGGAGSADRWNMSFETNDSFYHREKNVRRRDNFPRY